MSAQREGLLRLREQLEQQVADIDRLLATTEQAPAAVAPAAEAVQERSPPPPEHYDLSLSQAAWEAGKISDNGMKAVIRKHGDRLGRKVLGRWRVSSLELDRVKRLSNSSVCSVCSVADKQALPASSA